MNDYRSQVAEEIFGIVVKSLGAQRNLLYKESKFGIDVKADHLDMAELFLTLNEKYEVEAPPELMEKYELTIGDVITWYANETYKC